MNMRRLEKWLLDARARAWLLRRREIPPVLAGLDVPRGARCLEIGCGNGVAAMELARRLAPAALVAVDTDPDMIARARRHLSRPPAWARRADLGCVSFQRADAAALPVPDAAFDAAFLFGVLHPGEPWRQVLAETFRTLRPGGGLAFEEALIGDRRIYCNRYWGHVPFHAAELRAAVEEAGFAVERFPSVALGFACIVHARKPAAAEEPRLPLAMPAKMPGGRCPRPALKGRNHAHGRAATPWAWQPVRMATGPASAGAFSVRGGTAHPTRAPGSSVPYRGASRLHLPRRWARRPGLALRAWVP